MTSYDRMQLESMTKTCCKLNFRILGLRIIYGFWALGRFNLRLPDRYQEPLRIDGRFKKEPICTVKVGWRLYEVTVAKLVSRRGLRLWAWREAPLKRAETDIHNGLQKAKKEWDSERYNATSGRLGRPIL